ncbi:MAG: AGE family epimerase/isomerase [bacterium]|nr:AGE family epimerase/isomerase [bacterium]
MNEMEKLAEEMKEHLLGRIVPFWRKLRDEERGGWYGYVSYGLKTDRDAVKGCILNSRITWFFANVFLCIRDGLITEEECLRYGYSREDIESEVRHGFDFLRTKCLDAKNGGIYWSLRADGTPEDVTKHTYNQAFAIYALSACYAALGEEEALKLAFALFELIEKKCTDSAGYLEAFTEDFRPASNEKLSENGVMAAKTMNTLLHVFEAYSGLYQVSKDMRVREKLMRILEIFAERIYNPKLRRQEVFFDENYRSIIDLHSYGHDIETAWLTERGLEILGDVEGRERIEAITKELTEQIYQTAFDGHSLANECERGIVNTHRIWWVQAETVVGFVNGWQRDNSRTDYLEAARNQWDFIREHLIDRREGSEWFWEVDEKGEPFPGRPIVEPWKCPYHNGRMCMEIIRRAKEIRA